MHGIISKYKQKYVSWNTIMSYHHLLYVFFFAAIFYRNNVIIIFTEMP